MRIVPSVGSPISGLRMGPNVSVANSCEAMKWWYMLEGKKTELSVDGERITLKEQVFLAKAALLTIMV